MSDNRRINPRSLYNAVEYGFSHAVESRGGRLVHLSGQVAWDADRNIVGAGDLGAQSMQCVANLKAVLAEVGATPADVVRIRTYVVDHSPDKLGPIGDALAAFYGGVTPAANTLIGVQSLALPDFLIEIEATAQLPD